MNNYLKNKYKKPNSKKNNYNKKNESNYEKKYKKKDNKSYKKKKNTQWKNNEDDNEYHYKPKNQKKIKESKKNKKDPQTRNACKHGERCFDLKRGICRFPHPIEHLELIENQKHLNKESLNQETFIPSELNKDEDSLLKTKLRRWARLSDEEKIKNSIRINEMAKILEDKELDYMDFSNIFRILENVLKLKDQSFQIIFARQFLSKGFLKNDQVFKLRSVLVRVKHFSERRKIGGIIADFVGVWTFKQFCLNKLPGDVELIDTEIMGKLTNLIVQRGQPYCELVLDEDDEKLATNIKILLNLIDTVTEKRRIIFEDYQKMQKQTKNEKKSFKTPRIQVSHDKTKWTPPNNFRHFSDYPETSEIMNSSGVYLSQIVTEGGYQSVSHYLDVHYRLLREDFISSAKQGLQQHKKNQNIRNKQKNFDLTLYPKISVTKYEITRNFSGLRLRIPAKAPKKGKGLKLAKTFMFGSMVLLSDDKFRTFFVGIIRHNNEKEHEKTQKLGYMEIIVEVVNSELTLVEQYLKFKNKNIEMLESRCYFEAYYYVLKALKNLETFPLESMIIKCDSTNNTTPDYLRQYQPNILSKINQIETLDQSQRDALISTFNTKLSIIQGPPGTGKTFVGVNIMKILMELKTEFKVLNSPVLVVCYTNHALDQFLEHILKFTNKVCRLGGRTKNEELKKFSMRALVQNNFTKKNSTFYQVKDLQRDQIKKFNEMSEVYFEMENLRVLHGSYFRLANDTHLEDYLEDKYKTDFKDFCKDISKKKKKEFKKFYNDKTENLSNPWMFYWLGLLDFRHIHQMFKNSKTSNKKDEKIPDIEESEDENIETRQMGEHQKYQVHSKEVSENNKENLRIQQILNMEPLSSFPSKRGEGVGTFREQMLQIINCYGLDTEDVQFDQNFENFEKNFTKRNLLSMDLGTRWKINQHLVRKSLNQLADMMKESHKELKTLSEQLKDVEAQQHTTLANMLDVIAMTTTGACKYKPLLSKLKSKVIIIEEAAEVLEAQIVTSMSPCIEHMILIGDHQQLRPSVNSYTLAKDYFLEISLFERLVKNNFRNSVLMEQRRMRPEVSDLVRLIYPSLRDHDSVKKRPNIRGVKHNVFIFNHSHQESSTSNSGSKYNEFEAKMIVAFADYLIKQGYKGSQITILSLYLGQLVFLKSFVKQNKALSKVYIKTVDNYQGEENDIIILSLVRSNKKNNIGFLKVSNRVCVALSRARNGMFIFGDVNVLRNASIKVNKNNTLPSLKDSPEDINLKSNEYSAEAQQKDALWIKVIKQLNKRNSILKVLELQCQLHQVRNPVKEPKDFMKIPGGGCTQMCGTRLDCGHSCKQVCHPIEKLNADSNGHENYRCLNPCMRGKRNGHKCGHQCSYKCYECKDEPQDCMTEVQIKYKCGHNNKLKCFFYTKNKGKCMVKCDKVLSCEHPCKKACYEDCLEIKPELIQKGFQSPCRVEVEKQLPCGHKMKIPCGQKVDKFIESEDFKCKQKCGELLEDCQHPCNRECYLCVQDHFHEECSKKCGDQLLCNHTCIDACVGKSEQCPPCLKDCEVECTHSKCPKQCGEICSPCVEPCDNICEHYKCTKLCHEPCDRPPCDKPCKKKLECGHDCIGLCGDECPPVCRVCNPDHETFTIFFGPEDEPDSRFVYLPDCGHVIEHTSLDRCLNTTEQTKDVKVEYKTCPKCRTCVKKCLRYQRVIKETNKMVLKIKKKVLRNLNHLKKMYIDPYQINKIDNKLSKLVLKGDNQDYIKKTFVRNKLKQVYNKIEENEMKVQKSNRVASVHISTISTVMNIFFDLLKIIEENKTEIETNVSKFKALNVFFENIVKFRLSKYKLNELSRIKNAFKLIYIIKSTLREYESVKHLESSNDKHKNEESYKFLKQFKKLMVNNNFITKKENMNNCLKHLKNLKISKEVKIKFRQDIVKAMGLAKGHWYQCPNGHPYTIGECGGAMQESRCPDCNASIGGTSHRLTTGNRHAGEWDNSDRAAWDERNGEEAARRLQEMINRGEVL